MGEMAADIWRSDVAEGGWSGEESERETDVTDGRRRRRLAKPRPCAAAEVRLSVMSRRSISMKSGRILDTEIETI